MLLSYLHKRLRPRIAFVCAYGATPAAVLRGLLPLQYNAYDGASEISWDGVKCLVSTQRCGP